MKILFFVFPLLLFISCAQPKKRTFMPVNDLGDQDRIGAFEGDIDEEKFNLLIDIVVEEYTPIINYFGGRFFVNRLWQDPTVNASATQTDTNDWIVNMFGGLARREEITADGFTLVICHEIGHHLGGYPFVIDWAANEGSSDYYAILGCARHLWRDQPETLNFDPNNIPELPRKLCDEAWYSNADRKLCYRSMAAGKSTADLLGALVRTEVLFEVRDETVVDETSDSHPNAQCRLDTYMAAAICPVVWDDTLIPGKRFADRNSIEAEEESVNVSCSRAMQAGLNSLDDIRLGLRPTCWFKSKL